MSSLEIDLGQVNTYNNNGTISGTQVVKTIGLIINNKKNYTDPIELINKPMSNYFFVRKTNIADYILTLTFEYEGS